MTATNREVALDGDHKPGRSQSSLSPLSRSGHGRIITPAETALPVRPSDVEKRVVETGSRLPLGAAKGVG